MIVYVTLALKAQRARGTSKRASVDELVMMVLGLLIPWVIAMLCPTRQRVFLRLRWEGVANSDQK
jgi:hypothetical protein